MVPGPRLQDRKAWLAGCRIILTIEEASRAASKKASAMTDAPQFADPLNQVLNGRRAEFVPVAPVYECLGPLQFHRMALRWRKWRDSLDEAGTDLLPVDYQNYLDLELEIHTDIIDHHYPPPAWLSLPTNMTPDQVAGCAVVRQGQGLFWLSADGEAAWMPPNREAFHEALAADKTHHYARLWERGDQDDLLARSGESRLHDPITAEPSPEQARAASERHEYQLARTLLARYRGQLPLYYGCSSPYNTLLGLLGFQGMMHGLAERPEMVHRILESRLPRPSARLAALQRLGVGVMFVEECLASADVISPRMYREFVFPYTRQALQFYEDRGFRTVLYFSGNLMPLLEDLRALPFTALSFEEDRKGYGIDLAEVRRVLGPDRVLFGNLDALFVEQAPDEKLVEAVRRQIETAGAEGYFVVSLGSPFTPATSLDRVRLICESTLRV
jgi:hypothetical protein